jgi:hypothetical protein
MNRLIDYLNEHRWLKFVGTILSFSPIIEWVKDLLKSQNENSINSTIQNPVIVNHFDYFGLITAGITTLLLLLLTTVTFHLIKQLKEANQALQLEGEWLKAYKAVSRLSNFYRAWRFYTKEGMGIEYGNVQHRDHVLNSWLQAEYKHVFNSLSNDNPTIPPSAIHDLMCDYYGCDKQELLRLLRT